MRFAPGMLSSPNGSPGIGIPGCIIMNAHREVRRQYISVSWSANRACCSRRPRCRMGSVGYMFVKKKSTQAAIMSLVKRPGVGASVGGHGGHNRPCSRFATLVERVDCRWVSRSSLMTFALEPFGPFFWGIAWYVHES
jgi:hypothetical protein